MYLRKRSFILILFSLISYTSFSHELLPNSLKEKVYIFFSDEKHANQHEKTIKNLVTYSENEYHYIQLGTDVTGDGKYVYKVNKTQHGVPYAVLSHDQSEDVHKKVFHMLFFPHDRETGVYFVLGYSLPDGTSNLEKSASDQLIPKLFSHSGTYKRLF